MARQVPFSGKRLWAWPKPSSWRTQPIRSSLSPRSAIVKPGASPMRGARSRSRCAATPWKVPAHGSCGAGWVERSPSARCSTRPTRRCSSCAARREKLSSRMRCGSAPSSTSRATRELSVSVLPEPAPAITSSGGARPRAPSSRPSKTAARCSSLSDTNRSAARGAARGGRGVSSIGGCGRVVCRPLYWTGIQLAMASWCHLASRVGRPQGIRGATDDVRPERGRPMPAQGSARRGAPRGRWPAAAG